MGLVELRGQRVLSITQLAAGSLHSALGRGQGMWHLLLCGQRRMPGEAFGMWVAGVHFATHVPRATACAARPKGAADTHRVLKAVLLDGVSAH